jgi:hypothetical protein
MVLMLTSIVATKLDLSVVLRRASLLTSLVQLDEAMYMLGTVSLVRLVAPLVS